jgi:non-specific serine/threonine protein kinase
LIGTTVSHYRVSAKLGDGGMGTVYRAEDLTLQRSVALKFLPADLAADPRARRRLLQEARVSSRLNHPNIATIYEVDDRAESPFIAMELVEGETLRDVLARGALLPDRVHALAIQVAEGLLEAHRAGILHRDVKPGNVMLDARGRARILDFGLAIHAGIERRPGEKDEDFISRSVVSTTGGTVPYMAPEQLRGKPVDVRSDIFSFGALLYECLTGRRAFPGVNPVDVMHGILHAEPEPLRSARPGLPAGWDAVIGGCLAKEPEQRIASMEEVLSRLRTLDAPAGRAPAAPAAAPAPPAAEKSIAVLYFENLGRSQEDEYFRDGITEDVITELSKIRELRVFPRSAVLAFRDKPVTAPQVGAELQARYVLTGSLRRAGNRLRLTAQLVEARTGTSVWAERFDRQLEDVFAIQDELAQSIARALRVMLTESEMQAIEKKPTEDVQAYDFYLRGRQYFHQLRRKGFDYARQMFARAIVLDPNYARAYAGVADCCSLLYTYWEPTEENLREADSASAKALHLDPDLAESHVARGLAVSLSKKFDEAEREFETAVRLDPKLYEAYYFHARTCRSQGKLEKAALLFRQASDVRPEDYQAPLMLGVTCNGLGWRAEAEQAMRQGITRAEKHLGLQPDDARALYLGAIALGRIGQEARGLDWARRALELDAEEPVTLYNVACFYAGLRKTEEALDALERSVDQGFIYKDWVRNDPDLAPLRSHPRFQALLARL